MPFNLQFAKEGLRVGAARIHIGKQNHGPTSQGTKSGNYYPYILPSSARDNCGRWSMWLQASITVMGLGSGVSASGNEASNSCRSIKNGERFQTTRISSAEK